MSGRIVTVRHGRPNVDRSVQISSAEYGRWWADYDRAGLASDQFPPDSLREIAASCQIVLTSTLPRAIETAGKLVPPGMIVPQDALFVEAPLPPPPIPFLRLNPTRWGQISRGFWFLGFAPHGVEGHFETRARVRAAADVLIAAAASGQNVMLCAHGYLNWMLDGRMRALGWIRDVHEGKNHFWSYRCYRPKAARAAMAQLSAAAE